ncbi:MAG: ribbon-helix-helix protein, CopG family [Patescibacteria group bacterium]
METFNFRLDKETREKLDLIAKKHRRSRADIIRLMIEAEVVENEEEWA